MTRSTLCAAILALFGSPAWAALDESTPTVTPTGEDGSLGTASDSDDAAAVNARGGGHGRGGNGGHGNSGRGNSGSRGSSGSQHGGGSSSAQAPSRHAAPPSHGQAVGHGHAGGGAPVSNHPGAHPSSQAAAHHSAAPVAHKTVHPGTAARAHHSAGAHPIGRANPANHASVIFPRWKPSYHSYYLGRHTPAHWAHGVFIYSPPPARRVVVVHGHRRIVNAGTSDDLRAVDRSGDFGIGITTGSYMSTYYGGEGSYGDLGLGLNASYRLDEALGLEVAYSHHSETWQPDSERVADPLSASVKLFACPWTRVSPFLTVGMTSTHRIFDDTYFDGFQTQTVQVEDTLVGPHGGLGLELAIGDHAAIDFEGRVVGYLNKDPQDLSAPFAFQGTGGLNFYF